MRPHVNFTDVNKIETIGSLSSDVCERRTSTGSEPFPLSISLDATIFVLPSVLILIETICPKICLKSRLKSAKRPLPVDVRRSKTSLLKLPNVWKVTSTRTSWMSLNFYGNTWPSLSYISSFLFCSSKNYATLKILLSARRLTTRVKND